MSEWQPIETAPKEEVVLCFEPHSMIGFMFIGYKSKTGSWRDNLEGAIQNPTHWMELPTPPEQK